MTTLLAVLTAVSAALATVVVVLGCAARIPAAAAELVRTCVLLVTGVRELREVINGGTAVRHGEPAAELCGEAPEPGPDHHTVCGRCR